MDSSEDMTEEDRNYPKKKSSSTPMNMDYDDLLDEIDEIKEIEKDNNIFKTRKRVQSESTNTSKKKIKSQGSNNSFSLSPNPRKDNSLSPNYNKREGSLSPNFIRDNSLSPYSSDEQTQLIEGNVNMDETQMIVEDHVGLDKAQTQIIEDTTPNVSPHRQDTLNLSDTQPIFDIRNELTRNQTIMINPNNNHNFNNSELERKKTFIANINNNNNYLSRNSTIMVNQDNNNTSPTNISRKNTIITNNHQLSRNTTIMLNHDENGNNTTISRNKTIMMNGNNNNSVNNHLSRNTTIMMDHQINGTSNKNNNNNNFNNSNFISRGDTMVITENNNHHLARNPTIMIDENRAFKNNNIINGHTLEMNGHKTLARNETVMIKNGEVNDIDLSNQTIPLDTSSKSISLNINDQATQVLEEPRDSTLKRATTIKMRYDKEIEADTKTLARCETLPIEEKIDKENSRLYDDPYQKFGKNTSSYLRRISQPLPIIRNNSLNFEKKKNKDTSNEDSSSNNSTNSKGCIVMGSFDFDSEKTSFNSSFTNFGSVVNNKLLQRHKTVPFQSFGFDSDSSTQVQADDKQHATENLPERKEMVAMEDKSGSSKEIFEAPRKNDSSGEFLYTKNFPKDRSICLEDLSAIEHTFDFIESETESLKTIDRQDTVPMNILHKDTLSKIGILKPTSPKHGDVWIIYDDLAVESHDAVGSNFLLFGRSSENPNMAFTFHKISSKHCKIYVIKDTKKSNPDFEVWIEDLSSNGTYVNRELVGKNNKKLLKPDDILHLYIPKSSEENEEISYVLKEMIVDDVSFNSNPNCKTLQPTISIPPCLHGQGCFDKSEEHRTKFFHPN